VPAYIDELARRIEQKFGDRVRRYGALADEFAIEVAAADLLEVAGALRDDPQLRFEMLIDLAGVDYLDYGRAEWRTFAATATGFSRGVNRAAPHTLAGNKPKSGPAPTGSNARRSICSAYCSADTRICAAC
jgi:NADH-quinone oxidoreductase subunit C